ncbi:hypothetical protein Anas_09928, partial [Armadillidium nasatum]
EVAKSSINKVVMGNEACDLDSAVSSIAYAYFLQFLDKKMEFGVVYPVLNINRNDYPLRTENLEICNYTSSITISYFQRIKVWSLMLSQSLTTISWRELIPL